MNRTNDIKYVNGKSSKLTPKRSVLEEIGNAITHGLGAVFAIISLILMLINSVSPCHVAGAIVYSAGLFIAMSISCLYHAFPYGSGVKALFRRFDYISIYLLIGATFAPILLAFVHGAYGWVFFGVQWGVIALGITLIAVFGPNKLRPLHITGYVVLGWSGLLLMAKLFTAPILFWCVLGGGIIYSLGIIPFALKKKASHFIWHFFVLVGACVQWIGIFIAIY